jgi:hypothetical protein
LILTSEFKPCRKQVLNIWRVDPIHVSIVKTKKKKSNSDDLLPDELSNEDDEDYKDKSEGKDDDGNNEIIQKT